MMEFKVDQKELKRLINKLSVLQRGQVLADSLSLAAQHLAGWIKSNRLTGPRPDYLGVRSGTLRASIAAGAVERRANNYIVKIGTNVIYARIHEFGGVIRPRVQKYLKFRIGDQWYSKKQVTMPARPFMRPAIEDANNQRDVINILIHNIRKAIETA